MDGVFQMNRVLGLFPNWYAPAQLIGPKTSFSLIFPEWDPSIGWNRHEEALISLCPGDPPIDVHYRIIHPLWKAFFFSAAVECCNTLGKRGILHHTSQTVTPAKFSKSIAHFEYVPIASLLPHSSALVSHGGIGTIAQRLPPVCPNLLMPIAYTILTYAIRLKRMVS